MISNATSANPVMTGYAQQFLRVAAGFAGMALFPEFSTAEQSSAYYIWSRENSLNLPANLRHSPGAKFARSMPKISDDNYACKDYGHETPVPDEIRKKYANRINADVSAMKRNVEIIKVGHEKRVHTLATNTALVPNDSVAASWNGDATKPKGDVDEAKEAIRKASGQRANLMIFSEPTRLRLSVHPVIAERIKYTQTGLTSLQLLAAYFEIDRIVVAEQVQNSAQEGQAITPADIWADDVVIAHVNDAQDLMVPSFGRTFWWSEFGGIQDEVPVLVESYRDNESASDIHRTRHFTDEKLVYPEAGYLLTGALA